MSEKKGDTPMNAKRFCLILIFALSILITASACAAKEKSVHPVATQVVEKPAEVAAARATQAPRHEVVVTQVVEKAVEQKIVVTQVVEKEVVVEAPRAEPTAAPQSIPTPVDNTFEDYGVNPYIDTDRDHLSTFAIDVDTASYSVMRNYLTDGNLPPPEAVRIEEFVNYFDQDYPTPENVAFGVYADGAPSPFRDDGTYILRFGVQGYRVSEEERKPLVLTFVIDVSGSMGSENRLELVKDSLELLVERLGPDDTVGIVAYTTDAFIVLDPINVRRQSKILKAIYSLHPMDSTNVEAGLRLGYKMAMEAYQDDATNRVILCSDGVANTGNTDPEVILNEVHGYVEEGVTLTAVGVGMGNFNDVLLEKLADNGNGNYAYIDTIDEAHKVLVEDLVSTMQVIALDAKIQVDFNPEVVDRYRLIGYENRDIADQDFRDDSVDAGEIGAGHSATALYAVQFKPGSEGRIATIQLRWKDPDTYEVIEINGNFNTFDLYSNFEDAPARYQLDVVVAQFAEVLRESKYGRRTSFDALAEFASSLPRLLPNDPDVAEFADLVERAADIDR
jgi:Ca-activated chloride channel homolog